MTSTYVMLLDTDKADIDYRQNIQIDYRQSRQRQTIDKAETDYRQCRQRRTIKAEMAYSSWKEPRRADTVEK